MVTPLSPPPRLRLMQARGRRRGVVLVLVLWIAIILSLISYSVLFQVAVESSVTSARKRHLEAEALARAGVAKAIVDLRNDMIFDNTDEAEVFDAEGDVWADPEEGKTEVTLSRDARGYFTVRVHDEERLLNLNRFNQANMMLLRGIMEELGYTEESSEIAAAAVVDWRDSDRVPALPNAPSNEEGIAYAMIRLEDEEGGRAREEDVEPLVFRNEDYLTVDELLEVYGITPRLFFGPGTAEADHYENLLGESPGDLFVIDDDRPLSYDGETALGLRDYLTVHGSGAVNINTAPFHVLTALGNAVGQDGEAFAERVIRNRRGGRGGGRINNDNAYRTGTDVGADVEVAGVVNAIRAMGINMDVRSTTFRIVSTGVVGDTRYTMEVVVTRSYRRYQRDESFEALERAEERRERNSGRFDRRSDRNEGSLVRHPYVRVLQAHIR